jgi:chaperone modulatory protein CbpM
MSDDPANHRLEHLQIVTVTEACRICRVEIEFVRELVVEGVFEMPGDEPSSWQFDADQLAQLIKAARLARDLRVNPPGIALALELLNALDRARSGR